MHAYDNSNGLECRIGHEVLRIEPWGPHGLRVRSALHQLPDEAPGALGDRPASDGQVVIGETCTVTAGNIRCDVSATGDLRFLDSSTGQELLAEIPQRLAASPARYHLPIDGNLVQATVRFRAYDQERLYGLGQHQHGLLDQKGCVIDLAHQNTEVSIPFMISSRGYGLLWNDPSMGRVELSQHRTQWISEGTRAIDYWISTGSPRELLTSFTALTGRPPNFPSWASGFWQSRLRYESQEELLAVAEEHVNRGLPISVIVIDYLHWPFAGDWRFDPDRWPDPAAMVSRLSELGIELMVSVWPTVNEQSDAFPTMADRGMLMRSGRGFSFARHFIDTAQQGPAHLYFYDPSNEETRDFVWSRVADGYHRIGIKVFWLDACEPELKPLQADHWHYKAGPAVQTTGLYPHWNAKLFHDGLKSSDDHGEILMLSRSAWVGSQSFGVALWSGDVASTFEALHQQVAAGLNAGLSGQSWWGSDIGGFYGPDTTQSPYFRELVVRWFQFAAFTPIFRLHGHRIPDSKTLLRAGAPNEVWHFGAQAYSIIEGIMGLREALRPYIHQVMDESSRTGWPAMRTLFFEFPDDPDIHTITDQFLLGPDILVAPVLNQGASRRRVYLPVGAKWIGPTTREVLDGGQFLDLDVDLSSVPFYLRDGSDIAAQSLQWNLK